MSSLGRSIVVVDANTIWHRQLAEAIGDQVDCIAVEPYASVLSRSGGGRRPSKGVELLPVALPPGWASRTAPIGQRLLARRIRRSAKTLRGETFVILTSPAYRLLSRILVGRFPLIYYCADDYREYEKWGGPAVADAEAEIAGRCVLSVYVSEALRERAVAEYGVSPESTMVSPNATEPRFANREPGAPLALVASAARPIVGVLGAITSRLELPLLKAVADLDEVGTLLLAGPIASAAVASSPWLATHPKIIATGRLVHGDMHLYARAMDLALIPYARSALNYFCSPMRLFDHLANGAPIFATDACDQVNRLAGVGLRVAPAETLAEELQQSLRGRTFRRIPPRGKLFWADRARGLVQRIAQLEAECSVTS